MSCCKIEKNFTEEKGEKMETLNQRYRHHNRQKSSRPLMILFFLCAILMVPTTFARFLSSSSGTFGMEMAKWNIKINNVTVTPETSNLSNSIELVITDNDSGDGLIRPGQKGYFDILLDPTGTEVSMQYGITILTEQLPEEFQLTGYSINNSTTKQAIPNNKTIEGEILLDGGTSLTSLNKIRYRIYWEWQDEDAKLTESLPTYQVNIGLQVKQII